MSFDPRTTSHELAEHLARRQKRLRVVKTTTTPSGQIIDWIPIESQSAAGRIASPPPMKIMPQSHESRPMSAISFELEDPCVERGPAGTVPIFRPTVTALRRSLESNQHAKMRGGCHANRKRPNRKATDPDPFGYFHCINSENGTFYGADGILSVWAPSIDLPSAPGDDHSIVQFWLQNYAGGVTTSIEGGWTLDQSLNGDLQPHLFTFYTTNGYTSEGDGIGGYNNQHSGFVQYSGVVAPGALINGASSVGGAQFFIRMKFQLYAEPITGQLNWWIGVQGSGSFIWVGYYPASLFSGGVGNNASWVGSGGEVYSSLADPSTTQDQMGSGWQADAGWTKAAYLSNLLVQSDLNGTMADSNGTGTSDTATGASTNPYTIQTDMNSGSSWGSYIYVGGPTSSSAATALYDQITFNITTGGDDLRGDSSATATVNLPGGPQGFTLKNQGDGSWDNNSNNVRNFPIGGGAQPLSAFGQVSITLTSHNGFFETDDNWNIQSVVVTLSGPSGSVQLKSETGNPFARLTGSAPTVTF